jgi:8-oxo-dGTP diphosphatase
MATSVADISGLDMLETRSENVVIEKFKLLSAVHLFLIRDGHVLLLRRFNTGYEDGKYSVIAGHLNGDEEIKAAMIREAREEAGIEISPLDLEVVGVMHRKSNDERIDFFLATSSWSGEITNREPDKCDQVAWFDMDELPENVIPYVRRALDNYRRAVWFDSFGWS